MSPEQARGKPLDKRTDIWAFGCVLYEMLTDQAAFQGEDVTEILAAVVKSGVNLDLLPANIHFRIREVITRCLQKEQRKRYPEISQARYEIEQVLADPSGMFVQPSAMAKPRKIPSLKLPWVAAAIVLSLIVAGVAVWYLKPTPPPEPKQVARFEYELPEGQQFSRGAAEGIQYTFAVSPDGSQFVYNTNDGLYLRSIQSLEPRLIAGTDKDSLRPFFSPDGKSLGFWSQSDQKLKKVAVSGGAPIDLCDTGPVIINPSWDSEDTILYADIASGIMGVSANGGTAKTLIEGSIAAIDKGFPVAPQMLPDGKTLLFTTAFSLTGDDTEQIEIQSLESGERKVVIPAGAVGRYLPTGHIFYVLGSSSAANFFAVPFDLEKMEVTGDPVSVLEGVRSIALSESGTLVYVPAPAVLPGATSTALPDRTLVWVDRQGKEEPLAAETGRYAWLRISPDGTRVALSVDSVSDRDIWILDLDRETMTRLTFADGNDAVPIWTPDSQRIIFASGRESILANGIWWKKADNTGEAEKLYSGTATEIISPFSSSRDGKTLVLWTLSLTPFNANIETLSMNGDQIRSPLLQKNYNELYPQVSPNGRWIAYQSNESGRYEVFVRSFPDVNQKMWQVSKNGGDSPLWSPDGKELFYRSDDSFIAVEVETEPAFKIGNSVVLFKGRYARNPDANECVLWDIHPDGNRFLMVKPPATAADESTEEEPAPTPQPKITVILNWFEELKELVPVD